MTDQQDEQPKFFAVAHKDGARRPYIVRTAERIFAHSRKSGADKTILALIKLGYRLDQTGMTGAELEETQGEAK